jgi:hypothetical protein
MAASSAQLVGRRIRTEIWDAEQRVGGLAVSNFAVHPCPARTPGGFSITSHLSLDITPCEVLRSHFLLCVHSTFIMCSLNVSRRQETSAEMRQLFIPRQIDVLDLGKRPRWAALTGMVFGHVSIKKSSGQIRRYEEESGGVDLVGIDVGECLSDGQVESTQ